MTFGDVLDQKVIITILKNLLKNQKYSSPLMFTGIYGGGKTTLARIFARAVLCKNLTENNEPCNSCFSCKAFLDNANPAYNEIDAASNSGVDDVRKLKEEANFKVLGDYTRKVVVIDECHSISSKGNDALLKQLEDNTTDQIYIFCTTAPEKMHKTVRSRCLEFSLNLNSKESILTRLKHICKEEKFISEEDGLNIIATMSAPHVRDAIKTLEYISNFGTITNKIVSEHFKLNLENEYLRLVSLLKTNLTESFQILDNMIMQENISNIYEGILRNIIGILKLQNGINVFKTEEQKRLAVDIYNRYKDDLSKILENLLKRNKYVDRLTLESDLIILNKKLNTSFIEKTMIEKKYITTPAPLEDISISETKKIEEDISTKEEKLEINEKPTLENKIDNDELDKTTAVLKRYPTYSPKLAMMMAKSKQNNCSIMDQATVELKKKAKDLKKSLPRSEIRDFIELRKKGCHIEKLDNFSAK